MSKTERANLDFRQANSMTFLQLLINTLGVSVIDFTVWFAITFYTYIQTKSVFATGIIAGIFLVLTVSSGVWFGSLVDHYKKKTVMMLSSLVNIGLYGSALALYLSVDKSHFTNPASPVLWTLITLVMLGVIVGNIRTIAMPTLVSILIPEDLRDKANGLVGSASGVSMLVTSVLSGLLVAWNGMLGVLVLAIAILAAAIVHLYFVTVPERGIEHLDQGESDKKIDIRGTIKIVSRVPGLWALILFSTFNNFLGGVFMALMDPYGLELMSVQSWGIMWGVLSTGFIFGGLIIARTGLGKNPIKTLLLVNLGLWTITFLFPLQASIPMLFIGMLIYMYLIPYAEAAEQTVLQRVVPLQRQGRVFGFAQSVEQAASPLTAFAISPLAQFIFIPFMATGAGAGMLGAGSATNRGIALLFMLAAVIGLLVTIIALSSQYYRELSKQYLQSIRNAKTAAAPDMVTAAREGLTG